MRPWGPFVGGFRISADLHHAERYTGIVGSPSYRMRHSCRLCSDGEGSADSPSSRERSRCGRQSGKYPETSLSVDHGGGWVASISPIRHCDMDRDESPI